jgi:hypothetical protein
MGYPDFVTEIYFYNMKRVRAQEVALFFGNKRAAHYAAQPTYYYEGARGWHGQP